MWLSARGLRGRKIVVGSVDSVKTIKPLALYRMCVCHEDVAITVNSLIAWEMRHLERSPLLRLRYRQVGGCREGVVLSIKWEVESESENAVMAGQGQPEGSALRLSYLHKRRSFEGQCLILVSLRFQDAIWLQGLESRSAHSDQVEAVVVGACPSSAAGTPGGR